MTNSFFFIWRLSRFGKELFKYTPFLFRAAGQGKCNSVCIIEIQMLFIYYITTILILLFHIFETISQHLKWIKCPTNDIVFRCTAIVCSLNVYVYTRTYTSLTFIITIPCLQFTHTFEDETSHGARCILGNSILRSVFRCIHQISANVASNPGIPCIQKMHILFTVYTQQE